MVGAAVVGGAVIGGVATNAAADKGADSTDKASKRGVAEERRQFDKLQALLAPYVEGGVKSLGSQMDLLGLNGPDAAKKAIAGIESSPEFMSLVKQGETGILQNASATGGLRGGNTQDALSRFRPQVLAQLINDRFQRLGAITTIGQNSAAQTGVAAQNMGSNVAALLQQSGAAQAGKYMAQAGAVNDVTDAVSTYALLKNFKAV